VIAAFLLQATYLGQQAAYAVCKVITVGQGECGTPGTPGGQANNDRSPKEPCTVSSDQVSSSTEVAVLIVTAKDGRSFEVAKQNDGTYKVTRVTTKAGGVETGVGAGVSLTIDDNRYGGYVGADVGAQVEFNAGEVYIAKNDTELKALIDEELEDTVEDGILGDGPGRWLWERGQDVAGAVTGNGDHEFGMPDEIYAEGGVVVTASAEATGLASSGYANAAVSEGLGVKTTKAGKTTIYLKTTAKGKAQLRQLGVDVDSLELEQQGAAGSGELELLTAVSFDSSGNLVEVQTQSTATGQSKGIVSAIFNGELDPSLDNTSSGGTVWQSTLPVKSDTDRDIALSFLAASGVQQLGGPQLQLSTVVPTTTALLDFQRAAADRGTVTQQHLTTNNRTPFAVDAAGKLEIELGVSADVSVKSLTSTGGEYWDGRQWQTWQGCAA
jgi:hypothetical protein